MIKNDYGIIDTEDEHDLFREPLFSGSDAVMSHVNTNEEEIETSNREGTMRSLESLLTTQFESIKTELQLIKEDVDKKFLIRLFKCVICFESSPQSYMACFFCGRYLGCYACISKLNKCPLCRRKFRCGGCNKSLPKSPMFIPGIDEELSLPPIPRSVADTVGNGNDSDSGHASTIPLMGDEPPTS